MIYKYINNHIPFDNLDNIGFYTDSSKANELDIDSVIVQSEYKTKPNITEIQKLLNKVQPGDIIITSSLVNFSRAHITMIETLNAFLSKEVRIIAPMEGYDSAKYKDKSWLCQYEWQKKYDDNRNIVLRINQNKGIQKAKLDGKFQGHSAAKIEDYKDFERYYELLCAHRITKTKMANELGVSRPTLDKMLKQQENKE